MLLDSCVEAKKIIIYFDFMLLHIYASEYQYFDYLFGSIYIRMNEACVFFFVIVYEKKC